MEVEFMALAPGKWFFHCRSNHHMANNDAEEQGTDGLTIIVNVQ